MTPLIEFGIYIICGGIGVYFSACGLAKIIKALNGEK